MATSRLLEIFLILASTVITIHILIVGSDLLIPFVIAVVIWYLIISITSAIQKVSCFKHHPPYPLSLIFAMFICVGILYTIFNLITSNITEIIGALPIYQERLMNLITSTLHYFGIDKVPDSIQMINHSRVLSFATNVASTITSIAGNMGIIFIYVLFLLLEHRSFDRKLSYAIKDERRLNKTQQVIKKISTQIQSYLRIKTGLSIITAFLSYLVMYFVGVDFANFWAQLIFFLNFIPTIGSIIATILPCLLTILQFDSWAPFFVVGITLISIQFLIGNIIEPKVIGKSVNLSGLVIILSLALWGSIWGITGMFLCVPIMVILNITFSNFEQTRPISIMLSANGEIDEPIN
jgi:AI-2 transport protein TqsA